VRLIKREALIISPNRQRKEFELKSLQELKNSIEDRGLMHPIVVRDSEDGPVLVAGERRLKAIDEIFALGGTFTCDQQSIPPGMLPVIGLGELGELEAEEAELDENLKRKDLTWQEHAAAVARLHALRQKQHPPEVVSAADSSGRTYLTGGHTVADTAKEVYGEDRQFAEPIRREILVAKHLSNPEVARAKSADEAFKILKRQEEAKKNAVLAASVAQTFSAQDHTLLRGDCLSEMLKPELVGKFDVILTDPPYGMLANQFGDGGGKLAGIDHQYEDSYESWLELMSKWCKLSFSVTKPAAHAYVFCDIDRFHELRRMMTEAGWDVFRTPFIVHKLNSGRVPRPEVGPRRQWEMVLYAIKGNKPVTHIYPDVITASADEQMAHGAQKPVAVYQNLLQRSVRRGDSVLDSFAGSGTIFEAAHTMKVYATGIEKSLTYQGLCVKRLEGIASRDEPALF
jgi:DNA modification methylase